MLQPFLNTMYMGGGCVNVFNSNFILYFSCMLVHLSLLTKKDVSVNSVSSIGMDASVSMKAKQTDVFARLKNIIVMNVDSLSIHKKVITRLISPLNCGFQGPDATIHLLFV